MTTYTYIVPANKQQYVNDDLVGGVHDYLVALGFTVQGVSLQSEPVQLVVDCNADPSAALADYAGQLSAPRESIRAVASEVQQFIIAVETWKAGQGPQPTNVQYQQIVYDLATLLRQLGKALNVW